MTLILCLAFFLVAVALALRDPVEALLRYGTPADAARLIDQGLDLGALGFRPPGAQ